MVMVRNKRQLVVCVFAVSFSVIFKWGCGVGGASGISSVLHFYLIMAELLS